MNIETEFIRFPAPDVRMNFPDIPVVTFFHLSLGDFKRTTKYFSGLHHMSDVLNHTECRQPTNRISEMFVACDVAIFTSLKS